MKNPSIEECRGNFIKINPLEHKYNAMLLILQISCGYVIGAIFCQFIEFLIIKRNEKKRHR